MKKQFFALILGITFCISNNAFAMDTEELKENKTTSSPLQRQATSQFSFIDELELQNNRFLNGISTVYNQLDFDPRNWSSKTKIVVGVIGFFVLAYTINVLMTEARGALYGAGASRFIPAT